MIAGAKGRGSVTAGCPLDAALAPSLATRPVTADPPTDRHEGEHEKRQHEQAEHDPEGDIGSWSKAGVSHLRRG
jgi:hypothetical protein